MVNVYLTFQRLLALYPGKFAVASRIQHDSRSGKYACTLESIRDSITEIAEDEPGLGAVIEVPLGRKTNQLVFCKMDPEKIDQKILEKMRVCTQGYRAQFYTRDGPKLPRVKDGRRASYFWVYVLVYLNFVASY